MIDKIHKSLVEELKALCERENVKIVTAESCTGGMIATALTAVPGSSDFFERGFVTYSNESKTELLSVSAKLIEEKGAVSREVALAMADGALKNSRAHISVAVTGIAGPSSGGEDKPIGRVHIACAHKSHATVEHKFDFGNVGRVEVQRRTVDEALRFILSQLQDSSTG